jgi:hypothetical protein
MSTETDTAERFAVDVAQHQMTVLRDDGLYRHLRFMRVAPNAKTGKLERGSTYWFELVTWPGHLTITGDCGTYTLARLEDMFEFFRGTRINPQYWAEKVRGAVQLSVYSPERFEQFAKEAAAEAEKDYPGVTAAVAEEIFGDDSQWSTEYEDGAREALRDFSYGDTYYASCTCGERSADGLTYSDAEAWRVAHRLAGKLGHATATTGIEGFRFSDSWEWDLTDYDWQFLWCCHAIQWGIGQYDGNAAPAVETVAVAGGAV